MLRYLLLRLGQSVLTVFGVMVITFLLFRVGSGDIASVHKGQKATAQERAEWRHKYGYDRPMVINLHRRLVIRDKTGGDRSLKVSDPKGSNAANALALIVPGRPAGQSQEPTDNRPPNTLIGKFVWWLSDDTPIERLTGGEPLVAEPKKQRTKKPTPSGSATGPAAGAAAGPPATKEQDAPVEPVLLFQMADGSTLRVNVKGVRTCGGLIRRINEHPDNQGRLEAKTSSLGFVSFFDSQFFHHLIDSITFRSRSLRDNRRLTRIIADHAPASLAITVPALAIGWALAMVISCYVAYYRGSIGDKLGVFFSVLGMCIPFLAFVIFGQWLMFKIAPTHAYGVFYRGNVYLPIAIMVIAGIGGSVRFYRTIILDETNRDYVRTARAKGVPLGGVLYKHVLRNCMLPILTNLVLAIPFLFMGNLIVERSFGIPGLGDLMLSSITNRDEPILSGIVFLTALIFTLGILVTDLCYTAFDPRIRLR